MAEKSPIRLVRVYQPAHAGFSPVSDLTWEVESTNRFQLNSLVLVAGSLVGLSALLNVASSADISVFSLRPREPRTKPPEA